MMQPITTITNAVRVIDMLLHCPACGMQHVDEATADWKNPPHRSHLCHGCDHVWRPADVPTNGVRAVKSKGERDSVLVDPRDVFGQRVLSDGALDFAAAAVEESAVVWTGFARNDARGCIRAALAHGAAARLAALRTPPDVRPGAQFMVEMDSALRHAEAFGNCQIATSVVRSTILAYQAQVVQAESGTAAPSAAADDYQEVGTVWYERVNQEYHANLDEDLVVDGEKLYRRVSAAQAPTPADAAGPLHDVLNAGDIAKLRSALSWMGESTPESLEECEIYRTSLVRRLIAANLAARDALFGAEPAPELKDHEIREAVNQLRDVAIQFHAAEQLRSRIQDIVLPLISRAQAAR